MAHINGHLVHAVLTAAGSIRGEIQNILSYCFRATLAGKKTSKVELYLLEILQRPLKRSWNILLRRFGCGWLTVACSVIQLRDHILKFSFQDMQTWSWTTVVAPIPATGRRSHYPSVY